MADGVVTDAKSFDFFGSSSPTGADPKETSTEVEEDSTEVEEEEVGNDEDDIVGVAVKKDEKEDNKPAKSAAKKEDKTGPSPKDASDDEEEEDGEDEEDISRGKEDETKEEKPAKRERYVTFKSGKDEVRVKPSATVKMQVDGKEQEVTFEALRDSFASRTARRKEYEQNKVLKQQVDQKETALEQVITSFTERVEKGEAIPALGHLIAATGKNPIQTIRNIRNAILEAAEQYLQKTPEERAVADAVEEAAYYKWVIDQQSESKKKFDEQNRRDAKIGQIIEQLGIDRATYDKYVSELNERKKAGTVDLKQIEPEDVVVYHNFVVDRDFLVGVVKQVAPNLLNEQEAMVMLFKQVQLLHPSKKELAEVVRRYVGDADQETSEEAKPKKSLSTKLKNSPKSTPSKLKGVDLFL